MSKSVSTTDPNVAVHIPTSHPAVTQNAPRFLGPQDPFSTSAGSKVERAGGSNQVQEANGGSLYPPNLVNFLLEIEGVGEKRRFPPGPGA